MNVTVDVETGGMSHLTGLIAGQARVLASVFYCCRTDVEVGRHFIAHSVAAAAGRNVLTQRHSVRIEIK